MISALATGYLFLGGSGAGALFVLCVIEFLRTIRHLIPNLPVFSIELLRRAWSACLLCLCLGVVFLLFDLGNIDAVIYLFLTPQPVALTVGVFSLPTAIVCAGVFLALNAIDGMGATKWPVRLLSVVGAICAIIVMSYTGILLQSMASVIAWQTPLVPALFILSSLSCGVALVLGSIAFVETRVPLIDLISRLIHTDSALILLEALLLIIFVVSGLQDVGSTEAMRSLIDGSLSPVFWIGLVCVGLAIPFIMEQMVTFSSHRHQLLFIAAAVLIGGLAMRYCVVGLAAFDPAWMLTSSGYNQYALSIG